MNIPTVAVLCGLILFAGGCNRRDVIPEGLEGKVDRHLRYADIKQDPDAYRGKLMLAGGKVLSAERVKEGTKIEVLQIALSKNLIPEGHEAESKGRFVVMDNTGQVSDPAIFNDEKRITVVGEVSGTTTVKIDEVQQSVPLLLLKHVTVWDKNRAEASYAPYYGYGYPFWGYWGWDY